jgi:hypothetical protein
VPFAVQAYVPRRAFDALDIPLVVRLAKLAGIDRPRIESSTHKIPANIRAGSTRVTCSLEMALVLVDAFRHLAAYAEEREDGELLSATAEAVGALVAVIERQSAHARPLERSRRRTESPA